MKTGKETHDLIDLALLQINSGDETLASFLNKHPEYPDELRSEIEAALWLGQHKPSVAPRPAFLTASRARLEQTLHQNPPDQVGARYSRPAAAPSRHNRPLEVFSLLTLLICLIFVSHNVVLMSDLSLPGEPLYPVKLVLEKAHLAFTFDAEEDTRLQVQLSQRRTFEIIELILNENYSTVPEAANRLDRQLRSSLTALENLRRTNPAQSRTLSQSYQKTLATEAMILSILLDTHPPEARQSIELALQVTHLGLAALQD